MMDITLKPLMLSDCTDDLLLHFRHCKAIRKQWIRSGKDWILTEKTDVRQWSDEKKHWIPSYLKAQLERNGSVTGAYDGAVLVGFSAVDGELYEGYANLTMLFVDDEKQGLGIGRLLFRAACEAAAGLGADRLYISAIPSVETVAFYQAVGCRDVEVLEPFVDTEFDRPMAIDLK
ncbi:MAG: GNAT family N-acetyltransferase [Clostridia bacterium]|nr:GNAT family N-acetyltransferase [Clostridia bacterium]MBQ8513058.1 GNAT family N-acetyltransferase [Clostridia bacterium]